MTSEIDFMLRAIAGALREGIDSNSDKMSGENEPIVLHKVARQILDVLKQYSE